MEGRRIPKPLKVVLLVVAALLILVSVLGAIWWARMSKLSRESPAFFAAEIEAAARDDMIGPADIELLKELHAISASERTTGLAQCLCLGVGMAPLFRGLITDEDRRDMTLVRDFLLARGGRASMNELASFLRANPRILATFQTFGSTVKQAVARRRRAQSP